MAGWCFRRCLARVCHLEHPVRKTPLWVQPLGQKVHFLSFFLSVYSQTHINMAPLGKCRQVDWVPQQVELSRCCSFQAHFQRPFTTSRIGFKVETGFTQYSDDSFMMNDWLPPNGIASTLLMLRDQGCVFAGTDWNCTVIHEALHTLWHLVDWSCKSVESSTYICAATRLWMKSRFTD